MVELILEFLRELGFAGLFIGIVVEALSVPFPAALFVLVYGYILNPSPGEIVLLALGSAVVYTAFSYVPYFLSIKFEPSIRRNVSREKVKVAEGWIRKYGEWMIAAGRFLGMGYIAYIAGFSSIRPLAFGLYTFAGFFPLSLLMFYLGTLGNLEFMADTFQNAQWFIFSVLAVLITVYLGYRVLRKKGLIPTGKKEEPRVRRRTRKEGR
jgi:membrane protein DedA with SNARE-associated domain